MSSTVPCGLPSFHPPFCWSLSPVWTGSIHMVNDIAVPSLSPQPQAVHTWHTWGQAGYTADRLVSLAFWFYGLNFQFGFHGNILNSPGKEQGQRKVTFSELTSFTLHSPLDEEVTSQKQSYMEHIQLRICLSFFTMSYFQWHWARHRAMTRVRPLVWVTAHFYVSTTALIATMPLQNSVRLSPNNTQVCSS